jgi:hypothetical protein
MIRLNRTNAQYTIQTWLMVTLFQRQETATESVAIRSDTGDNMAD